MKVIAVLIAVSLSACSSTRYSAAAGVNEGLLVTGFPHLPVDARNVAERLASCSHFYGEISGDAERDKEIMNFLSDLRCSTIDNEAASIRTKYATDKAIQDALVQAAGL